jgi:SPP1 gp7 family putative phage head morphogenesis protein
LRDDILAAFGVPKAMVTSDDVNLANAKEAYRMFLQEAVIPALATFVDVINNRLVPQMDIAVFFDFTDPTPLDREMLLKEATELKKSGIITANEGRALFNYEAMEGADTLSMAQNSPATGQDTAELKAKAKEVIRSRHGLAKRLNAIEKTVDLVMLTQPKRSMNSIFATKEMKQAYAKAVNDKADRKAEVLKAAVDEFHDGLLKRILATDLQPVGFMDLQAEKITAKNALTPVVVDIYRKGGQEALDALFRKSTDQFFTDEQMIAAMQARAAFFTESMMDTTYEVLQSKIVAGIGNGDGVAKIADSLRDYFKDMGVKRSMTIARTETGYALSKATNDAYNQSSVVTGKEWISVGDDDVRKEHKENDGKIVAKNGAFPNGEHYPGEHSINCRCVLSAAV